MRSPFSALPSSKPDGEALLPWFAGTIAEVKRDTSGQPSMLFAISPDNQSRTNGGTNNTVNNVVLLVPLFGDISNTTQAPTGMYGIPRVGARVLVVWDGSRWGIIGFYTGPARTPLEAGNDPEKRVASHNPGLELALNRLIAPPGWDVPNLFGLDDGDIVLGNDQARVKVSDRGALIGFGPDCLTIFTREFQRIDRFADYEGRSVGWWMRRTFRLGSDTAAQAYATRPNLVTAPTDAAIYECELIETSPYPLALRPYVLKQRGHIARSVVDLGRSAIKFNPSGATTASEAKSGDHLMLREAIVHPLTSDPSSVSAPELNNDAYQTYDYQVDPDGSVRLRAGNQAKLPGGQGPDATGEMDFSFEYDAATGVFMLRIGPTGKEVTKIIARGDTPANAEVEVSTGKLTAKATDSVQIEATKKIGFKSSKVVIDAAVEITGQVKITGEVTVNGELKANGVAVSTHVHPYINVSSPAITSKPQ